MEKEEIQNNKTTIPEGQSEPKEVPQPAIQVPETHKRKSWFIVVISALTLLLLGTTSYFAYQNYQLKKKPTQAQPTSRPTVGMPTLTTTTPSSTVTPSTPTIDPTAGWQIYTNEKYKYSIKYPPEVKVQEGPGGEERIQETIFTLFGPKYQGPGEFTDGFGITLAVIKNLGNKTPTQFAQDYYQQAKENIDNKILEGDISKCKVENIVKDNINGARFTYCIQAPGSGILNFSEWYVKNGVTYQIYAVLQNEDYLATFDQALSTFKFLQ